MKYCHGCRQWNLGQPPYCRFCGRTWNVRLCQSGHENPTSAMFCGICGSARLTEPAPRLPLLLRVLGGAGRILRRGSFVIGGVAIIMMIAAVNIGIFGTLIISTILLIVALKLGGEWSGIDLLQILRRTVMTPFFERRRRNRD